MLTVLSGAVSGGLCDLDRVSGGGDTDVSGVDSVVSGAVSGCLCDLDSVSRGDIIIIIQHLFLRHISSHCDHSEAHYSLKQLHIINLLYKAAVSLCLSVCTPSIFFDTTFGPQPNLAHILG